MCTDTKSNVLITLIWWDYAGGGGVGGGVVGVKGSLFKWTYKRTGLRGHH